MSQAFLKYFIAVSLCLAVLFFWNPPLVQDLKLSTVPLWGYFTLTGNPLLPSLDEDLQQVDSVSRLSAEQLLHGGPPKDGIPALDAPLFVAADETPYGDEETVIGVAFNGEAKAYPYKILDWHEIVNDRVGGLPISVTLCPLCDTTPVFVRRVNGQETTFGVSGKLFQSCLVMYDRLTDSLWYQPWGLGVAGSQNNVSLERVTAHKTTLGAWKAQYPETQVLSTDTGHRRDYFRYPYGSYQTSAGLIFPVRRLFESELHPKAIVSYVWQADAETPQNHFSGPSAWLTHEEARSAGRGELFFGTAPLVWLWDEELSTVRFFNAAGEEQPSSTAFAFVVQALFAEGAANPDDKSF